MAADSKTAATFSFEEGLTYHPPSASEPKTITTSNLIALLPPDSDTSSSSSSETYTLLYLNTTSSSSNPIENPTLSALRLSTPSDALKSRFSLNPKNLPPHLYLGSSDTHVIVSTSSGLHKADSYHETIIHPLFEKLGIEYTLHKTTSASSIQSFTTDLLSCYSHGYTNTVSTSTDSKFDKLIILLSGDTGIQEFLNNVPPSHARLRFLLSVIPLGTANALASSLHLNLSSLLHGSPHHLPTFTAEFSCGSQYVLNEGRDRFQIGGGIIRGCVVCSFGFHASLVGGSDTVEYRVHGNSRFGMLAKELLEGKWGYNNNNEEESGRGMHVYKGRVRLNSPAEGTDTVLLDGGNGNNGEEGGEEGKGHSYVMLPMIPRLEPTFTISPDTNTTLIPLGSKREEEKVEGHVVYIPSTTPENLQEMMMQAYAGGKHVQREDVGYYKAGGFRIDMLEQNDSEGDPGRWRWVCVDGKIIEVEEGGYVDVKVDQEVEDWGILWRE